VYLKIRNNEYKMAKEMAIWENGAGSFKFVG
jgi:hypothetical protein